MTTRTDDGGYAFPHPALANEGFCPSYDMGGMSLRDWFAGQQNLLDGDVSQSMAEALMGEKHPASDVSVLGRVKWWAEAEARYKYLCADAMLAARKGGAA